MAITSLKNLFQLQKTETGYITATTAPCGPGGSLPVYIPRIMQKIDSGPPTISVVSSLASGVFINDPSCKPVPFDILETQNFITPKFENNNEWTDNLLTPSKLVPRKTKVTCNCHSNSISHMTFSNNVS